MAWATPLTAVSNATLTAAQWNASVRDNLLETVPAKATAAGRIFVSTGANAIAERVIAGATITTSQSTTSTTFTDLAAVGPAVTVTTGTTALVFIGCDLDNTTTAAYARAHFAVTGASSVSPSADKGVMFNANGNGGIRIGVAELVTGLTPGSNTFTMKYLVGSGTGNFADRYIVVMAL